MEERAVLATQQATFVLTWYVSEEVLLGEADSWSLSLRQTWDSSLSAQLEINPLFMHGHQRILLGEVGPGQWAMETPGYISCQGQQPLAGQLLTVPLLPPP